MTSLGYQKPGKLLNGGSFATAIPRAAVMHFLLEPVPKCGWAESLANVAHECHDGGGKDCTITLRRSENIYELFKARSSMTLPEWNAAAKKTSERPGGFTVAGKYQK